MLLKKQLHFLLAYFMIVLSIPAQNKKQTIALKEIIASIENRHHVTFNYSVNINETYLIAPEEFLSLEQQLMYLEKQTDFYFENIDNKFINISLKTKKKPTTLCGYIYSSSDNKPIENANIKTSDNKHITSNSEGYFEIKKTVKSEITISHIGFTTKKINQTEIKDNDCIKIILESELTNLQEIITNSVLATGITKNSDGSFIIKPKKFSILPGLIEADILQTMQQIPGVNSHDESVANINIRGGTHDQNLFLWNGIRMYQTGHFFGLISAFNPNLPHNISIYKNGSSAFYGESVSSVVNISSTPENFEKNTISAGINMINADFYAKKSISKTAYIEISGRKSITDYLETPTYVKYFDKAFQNTSITDFSQNQKVNYSSDKKFNFYDLTFKLFKKLGRKNTLILDLISINDNLNVSQKAAVNNSFQSQNDELEQENFGGNLLLERNWNKFNQTIVNASFSSYEIIANKKTSIGSQIVFQKNNVLDNAIKIENHHFLSPKFSFNNGYQFNEIGITNLDTVNSPQFYRKSKSVLRTHAAILESKFNDSISRMSFNTGVRFNFIENFNKLIIEPRLQFNYGISKHLNLEVLAEFKSQNTQQIIDLQKDYLGIEKRRWVLSNNSTIPIQQSKQIALNFSFKKNNWLINLENFYKKVDGITSSSQGFQNQLEFLKITGNYKVIGTEMLLQKKINPFLVWLSYTYNKNNYHFDSFSPPTFSNNFLISHMISGAAIFEKNNFKIALGTKWATGRPETTPIYKTADPNNPVIEYNSPNNKRLPSFFQVNFSSTYKWESAKNIQYKLGLSIMNVLNRKNEISEYYRISNLTNGIEEVKTFSLQRTPNISFRINF